MKYRDRIFALAIVVLSAFLVLPALGQEGDGGNSLGDLLKKVKDIKVPESVTGLPEQITELKNSYLETAKTVEDLQHQVEMLRQEVYELKKQNETLSQAVGAKVEATGISDLLKPTEISSTQLVEKFEADRALADERYRDKYLKVVGIIEKFETGPQAIEIFLRADGKDSMVQCQVPTGPDVYVEAQPSQGRIISRNDRRTMLSVGQPISVVGTCRGISLNVEMKNCKVDGFSEKKIESAPAKK